MRWPLQSSLASKSENIRVGNDQMTMQTTKIHLRLTEEKQNKEQPLLTELFALSSVGMARL